MMAKKKLPLITADEVLLDRARRVATGSNIHKIEGKIAGYEITINNINNAVKDNDSSGYYESLNDLVRIKKFIELFIAEAEIINSAKRPIQ
jgi:hypothetical protein